MRRCTKPSRAKAPGLKKRLAESQLREADAREQQSATTEILRVIGQSPADAQPVFDAIVRSAVRLCDGVFSIVGRFDGEYIHFGAEHNFNPEALAAYRRWFPRRAVDDHLAGRALLERRVMNVSDVTAEFRFVPGQQEQGFRSVLFVPMVRDGVSIGVIGVSRMIVGPFPDNQVELLQTFADQVVIAIENVRLFKARWPALGQESGRRRIDLQVHATDRARSRLARADEDERRPVERVRRHRRSQDRQLRLLQRRRAPGRRQRPVKRDHEVPGGLVVDLPE
jgi:GAF domain-containing protein